MATSTADAHWIFLVPGWVPFRSSQSMCSAPDTSCCLLNQSLLGTVFPNARSPRAPAWQAVYGAAWGLGQLYWVSWPQ